MPIRRFLSLALLSLLLGAPAAAQTVRSARSANPAVGRFQKLISFHVARLGAEPAAALAELRELAARAGTGAPDASLERESARLLAGMLASPGYSRPGREPVLRARMAGLIGDADAAALNYAILKLHLDARDQSALRQELGKLQAQFAREERADLAAVSARLDSLFAGSAAEGRGPPRRSWLGEVPEEPGESHGTYIAPNERNGHLYAPLLKSRKGVLLSVGTFRSLNDVALGGFSRAVLLDNDRLTAEFNRANLALIKASEDRYEYLSGLLDRPFDKALRLVARSSPVPPDYLLKKLLALPKLEDSARSPQIMALQGILAEAKRDAGDHPRKSVEERLTTLARSPVQWENTYLGSDRLFAKVRAAAQRGRLAVVDGDLTGPKALAAAAQAMKDKDLQVSALDMSNAHNYIKNWRAFLGNLEALPFSPDASILFTVRTDDRPRSKFSFPIEPLTDDYWLYFAVPASDLVTALKAGLVGDGWDFLSYARKLFEGADPASREKGLVLPGTGKKA